MLTRDEQQKFNAARTMCRDSGCFVVVKPGAYLIYREVKPRNVLVAKCKNVDTLLEAAKKV